MYQVRYQHTALIRTSIMPHATRHFKGYSRTLQDLPLRGIRFPCRESLNCITDAVFAPLSQGLIL